MEKRQVVTNATDRMMLLFTEPEAQAYWLQPGESIELRADVASTTDDFKLIYNKDECTVWPSNGMGYISVWSGGTQLLCGHQRPADRV